MRPALPFRLSILSFVCHDFEWRSVVLVLTKSFDPPDPKLPYFVENGPAVRS